MKIIDAHMHLWDLSRNYYGWLQDDPLPSNPAGDMTPIARRDYLVGDYLSDTAAAEIEACVHIECGLPLERQLSETGWLEDTAETTGLPTAIVAGAVLEHPSAGAQLAVQAARSRVRGVRQIVNWHPDPAKTYTPRDLLDDPNWRRGFSLLSGHGLSFDLQIYPAQMEKAAAFVSAHPETAVILNHAGMPTDRDAVGLAAWRQGMAALARLPNVSVKISGLSMVDRAWTADSLRPFILTAIELFSPDRCMFGSNLPVDRVHGAFEAHLAAFMSAIGELSADEKDSVLRRTAIRVYRL